MLYSDYPYYSGVYMGVLCGADFQRLVVRASSYIDYFTGGNAADKCEMDAVKMCCCALVDKFAVIEAAAELTNRNLAAAAKGEPEIKSESVGSYSRTLATVGEGASAAVTASDNARSMLNKVCSEYLAHTGLLYRGGKKCLLPTL